LNYSIFYVCAAFSFVNVQGSADKKVWETLFFVNYFTQTVPEGSPKLRIQLICKNTVPFQVFNMEKYEQIFLYKITEIQNM